MCAAAVPFGEAQRTRHLKGPAPGRGRAAKGNAVRARAGLSRSQRLRDTATFREAFEQRRKFVGRLMVIWLRMGQGANLRLGVVASRRTFRKAVARNRARRLLREAYRLHRCSLKAGCDVVLVARRPLEDAGLVEVERDLLRLSRKAGILQPPQ